jgi:hypothetical protein
VCNKFNIYALIIGRSSCTDEACRRKEEEGGWLILGFWLFVYAVWSCHKWWKGRSVLSNSNYVNSTSIEIAQQDSYQFESGLWSSRYYQYHSWHGPHRLTLSFDSETYKAIGNGSDDVGTYTIEGIYSTKTYRIGLTKTYQKGTGDPKQNFGHNATIQLAWNTSQQQFVGKWSVQTSKYSGEDKFELKLEKAHEVME